MDNKIKVLIVDDSALVRQALSEILSEDNEIEVIGTAADPYKAVEKIKSQVPDVITLDIEMPRMDGITFLTKIMNQHPIPVVICSSIAAQGSKAALQALKLGAVEVIEKPKMNLKDFFHESKILITDIIKAASKAKLNILRNTTRLVQPKLTADVIISKPNPQRIISKCSQNVIFIGASTGGTEALRAFLQTIPVYFPGIVIVQHMPEYFTNLFAKHLNETCEIEVKEARDNDEVIPGRAIIAQGNKHLMVKRRGNALFTEVKYGPLVSRHRPSVDVLFRSAARYCGESAIGIIMTGMGDDGAQGMLEMKVAGAYTIAQSEKTCVVFGMPKEAIRLGGVKKTLDLNEIPQYLLNNFFQIKR